MTMILGKCVRVIPSCALRGAPANIGRPLSSSAAFKETKVKVLDVDINYLETTPASQNAHPIFFLPGAFGSIEMDFKPILPQLNTQKYRWIAWDPPGYGKSRPPNRDFFSDKHTSVNAMDVKYSTELMNILGYPRYTLLAWSGAGITSFLMASQQPEKVAGIVTWGAFGHVDPKSIPGMEAGKKLGLKALPENRGKQLVDMYGKELLLEMWVGWCDEGLRMATLDAWKENGTFQRVMQSVECPVLVIQGLKDALITPAHADYICKNIKNSKLHIIENGTHNLHLRETAEFVTKIEEFVDSQVLGSQAKSKL